MLMWERFKTIPNLLKSFRLVNSQISVRWRIDYLIKCLLKNMSEKRRGVVSKIRWAEH